MPIHVRPRHPWTAAHRRYGIWKPYRYLPRGNWLDKQKRRTNRRKGHPAPWLRVNLHWWLLDRTEENVRRIAFFKFCSILSAIGDLNHRRQRYRHIEKPWFITRMREDKIFCRKCGHSYSNHQDGLCPNEEED